MHYPLPDSENLHSGKLSCTPVLMSKLSSAPSLNWEGVAINTISSTWFGYAMKRKGKRAYEFSETIVFG
jgi:hypothetical protein